MELSHFIVSCEFKGNRKNTVEVPVSVVPLVTPKIGAHPAVDVTTTIACELAERVASNEFGGVVDDWFAWKIVPDTE